jgi:hypothetical protein
VIGYKSCHYVLDVEQAILDATASPLNLKRKTPSGYASLLQNLRRRFRDEIVQGWPKAARTIRPVRR